MCLTSDQQALVMHHVTKRFRQTTVLQDLSLAVEYGELVGIVGANGAGKSLILRVASGLVYADAGSVVTGGQPLKRTCTGPLAPVGLLLETPGFLPYLSGRENLSVLAMLEGDLTDTRITEALEQVGLPPGDARPVRLYS